MSDQATDGSSHHGDPSRGQWTDGEATPGYSTDASELLNNIGSQFSDPRYQYTQQDWAGRPNRGDIYEQSGDTERFQRTRQPPLSQGSQIQRKERQVNPNIQTLEDHQRHEGQQRVERQLHEAYRRHEERLAAQLSANRKQYTPNDPKGEDGVRQIRRRKPR